MFCEYIYISWIEHIIAVELCKSDAGSWVVEMLLLTDEAQFCMKPIYSIIECEG